MIKCSSHIRASKKMMEKINYIRARCLLEGIKPPTMEYIQDIIADNIDKEKIWHEIIK